MSERDKLRVERKLREVELVAQQVIQLHALAVESDDARDWRAYELAVEREVEVIAEYADLTSWH